MDAIIAYQNAVLRLKQKNVAEAKVIYERETRKKNWKSC